MRVYLDTNATTAVDGRVRERMAELMALGPLNPGSTHAQGRKARELWADAQASVLATLSLTATHDAVFCGSATEAINLAIRGCLAAMRAASGGTGILAAGGTGVPARASTATGKDPCAIALSSVEHPAVALTVADVAMPRVIQVDRHGALDLDALPRALDGAALAAFMYANNETGGMLPVADIARACRAAGVPLLLDCCQAPGKTAFRVPDPAPDMLVVSGHKMYGPLGIAVLLRRKGLAVERMLTGGGQQHGLRAGTEPVVLASALALALELACAEPGLERMRAQTDRLFAAIREAAPGAERTIADPARCLANTLHYRIPGLTAERQVIALDVDGIECSAAAACESGAAKPSKVMLGMGFGDAESKEGVRVSVGRYTSEAEIAFACEVFQRVLGRLLRK